MKLGYFEQLLKTGGVNLIIGGALILIAIIAVIWMYLWFKKTKEYNNILKSIDDKVDACSKEEIEEILRNRENSDKAQERGKKENKQPEEEKNISLETVVEAKPACSFNRASAAIETLEHDEKKESENLAVKVAEKKNAVEKASVTDTVDVIDSNKKELIENINNIKENDIVREAIKTIENTMPKDNEDCQAPIIEKIYFDKTSADEIKEKAKSAKNNSESLSEKREEITEDAEDDECEVDVFAEIRKMLVETEKNSEKEELHEEHDDLENVARSGKEYTREELEKLIKF